MVCLWQNQSLRLIPARGLSNDVRIYRKGVGGSSLCESAIQNTQRNDERRRTRHGTAHDPIHRSAHPLYATFPTPSVLQLSAKKQRGRLLPIHQKWSPLHPCHRGHGAVPDPEEVVPYPDAAREEEVLPPVCEKRQRWTVGLRAFSMKRAAYLRTDQ